MRWWTAVGVAAMLVVSGCGSSMSSAATGVAERFYQALASKDGAAACAVLAPPTVEEIEESADAPCRMAILDEDVPDAGAVVTTKRYGGHAQVVFQTDTAFVAEFDDGWKVVAAACTASGELPYDCKVEG